MLCALGGDGFMLQTLHRHRHGKTDLWDEPGHRRLPDERVSPDDLLERLAAAERAGSTR